MENTLASFTPTTPQPIIDTISFELQVSTRYLFTYTRFIDDLNLDELDKLLLIANLESRFGVFLDTETAASIDTIGDVVRCFSLN